MEVGHTNLTQLEVVGSMHERKKEWRIGRSFHCTARGLERLDELAEILTWKQLG